MDDIAGLTSIAHRAIRRVDAPECAFEGELVADGDLVRVRVAAERIPEPLWGFADAEHVVGVCDVIRTPGGHDALLPWCPDPVEVFLGRRTAAEQPLSAGEIVTLVGSLLRGVVEAGDTALRGRWWLTDDARPMFAVGEGSGCADAAVQIIARVRDGCDDRLLHRLLGEVAAQTADPRAVRRRIAEWERELTELAAPRALQRDVFPAERVSEKALHRQRAPQGADAALEPRSALVSLRSALDSVLDRMRTRTGRLRERLRSMRPPSLRRPGGADAAPGAPDRPGARRGRLTLVGATVAAVVLGAGLLLPPDADDSAAIEQPANGDEGVQAPDAASARRGSASPTPSASALQGEASHPAEGVAQSARRLLGVITACAETGDAECAEAIVPGSTEVVLDRLSTAAGERKITPVEDYGDIAVVRLGAAGETGEQMLVLVRQKDGWLVRDVYDIADQPSGAG